AVRAKVRASSSGPPVPGSTVDSGIGGHVDANHLHQKVRTALPASLDAHLTLAVGVGGFDASEVGGCGPGIVQIARRRIARVHELTRCRGQGDRAAEWMTILVVNLNADARDLTFVVNDASERKEGERRIEDRAAAKRERREPDPRQQMPKAHASRNPWQE